MIVNVTIIGLLSHNLEQSSFRRHNNRYLFFKPLLNDDYHYYCFFFVCLNVKKNFDPIYDRYIRTSLSLNYDDNDWKKEMNN